MANVIVTGARAISDGIAEARYLALRTSGTPTIASGACTIDSTDLVQAPSTLMSTTTGWIVACVKPSWISTSPPGGLLARVFDMGGLKVYYDTGQWYLESNYGTGFDFARLTASHAAGSTFVVSATWDATTVKVTKGTTAFDSRARTINGQLTTFTIGNTPTADRPFTGDFYWLAAGSSLLTQAESDALVAFGSTDPTSLPSSAVLFWDAASFVVPRVAITTGGDGMLTAATGPVTASGPTNVAGSGAGAGGAGSTGVIGMFTAWTGQGVATPFVIGVTAQATATAQPGTFPSTNITIVGTQALATATANGGTFPLENPTASLVLEIDFVGNPAAPFFDQVSQSPGVVSYWRFDDAGQLTDTLGVNTGAITGAPTLITGALAYDTDQALRFNGTTQYGQVPSSATLAQTGSYSLSGWVRFPTLPSAAKTIVSKGNYRLEINSSNQLVWSVTNDQAGTLTNTSVTAHNSLEANTWYRVVGVHEFGIELRLYVNGVLDNSAVHTVGTELHTTPVTFAGNPYGATPSFRSVGTASPTSLNSLFVIPNPSYVQGDLLLAHIALNNANGSSPTMTAPTGWSLLSFLRDASSTGAYNHQSWIYWKYAGVSEPSSYTWTSSINTAWSGAISSFGTVNPTNPFAKPVYQRTDVSNTTIHSTGPHFMDANNTLALALIDGDTWEGAANAFTWGSGTERYEANNGGAPTFAVGMSSQVPTSGTTLNVSVTSTHTSNRYITSLITLAGTGVGSYTAVDLDEWTFWNVALSDQQVANEYEARSSGVGTWTDVSADAKGLAIGYGRQYELNRIEGGSANVTLKNQLRKYDPANTSSVYAPNVKPNRRIRARAYYRGVYYPLWEGLIERWPSNWGISPNYDEVELTSVDGVKALNRAGVSPTQPTALSGTQIDLMLTRALWSIDARAVDSGAFIMAADTTTDTTTAKAIIDDVADSELGLFLINHGAAGSPATFHDRSHRWTTTRSVVSQATFTDQTSGGIRYRDLQPSDDDDNMVNEWIVTSANGTTATAIDSVSRQQNFPLTSERSTRLDNTLDADTQAKALIQQTARPGLRFDALTVRLMTQTTPIIWQTCLGLAISDRVTVIRNPVPGAGGSTITKDCFVEGISWDITPSYWDLSLRLSPVTTMGYYDVILLDDPVSYWRLDTVT